MSENNNKIESLKADPRSYREDFYSKKGAEKLIEILNRHSLVHGEETHASSGTAEKPLIFLDEAVKEQQILVERREELHFFMGFLAYIIKKESGKDVSSDINAHEFESALSYIREEFKGDIDNPYIKKIITQRVLQLQHALEGIKNN